MASLLPSGPSAGLPSRRTCCSWAGRPATAKRVGIGEIAWGAATVLLVALGASRTG